MRKTSVIGPIFVGSWLSSIHCYKYAHKSSDETATAQHQLFGRRIGVLSREIVHFICWNRLGRLDFASDRLWCVLLSGIMCIGSHNYIKWFALQYSCKSEYFYVYCFYCAYMRVCMLCMLRRYVYLCRYDGCRRTPSFDVR